MGANNEAGENRENRRLDLLVTPTGGRRQAGARELRQQARSALYRAIRSMPRGLEASQDRRRLTRVTRLPEREMRTRSISCRIKKRPGPWLPSMRVEHRVLM